MKTSPVSAIINEQIRINEHGGKISCLLITHEKCKYCGKFLIQTMVEKQLQKAEECHLLGSSKYEVLASHNQKLKNSA